MTLQADPRITSEHRVRDAVIYIRQSSREQVRKNQESTRFQRGLRDRAIQLGWRHPVAIEDDLGVSAAGFADRPGFQRLLADVAVRKVGIILCSDASRLSRNFKDWAHLFELCGHFGTLVADVEQVYDLSVPNDRLVLGIKGTVAEMELAILRNRMRLGTEAKAARGELKFLLPPGYVHDPADRIVLDPDKRVQAAISSMFEQFDQCTSIRQLALRYRDGQVRFPVRRVRSPADTAWQVPSYSTLRKLLVHPVYAGAYVWGRRRTKVEYENGRLIKRVKGALPPEEARVFIQDHHPAYISWEQFLENRAKISEARPRWNMHNNRGAIRKGQALLTGMVRCGHCGRMMRVGYRAGDFALYQCSGGEQGSRRCLSFGSKLIDAKVGAELARALEPAAIEAAHQAFEQHERDRTQHLERTRLDVEAAQYEADRAFEQFNRVDPRNRLVADVLEERLNHRLAELQTAKARHETVAKAHPPLNDAQRTQLQALSRDFAMVWNHPGTTIVARKELARTLIQEVVVRHIEDAGELEATIHWQGGVHTRVHVKKRRRPVGGKADTKLIDLVRGMAQSLDDPEMARILNMQRRTTPRGLIWTKDRVRGFRRSHHIRLGRQHDPDVLTAQKAAAYLGISRNGLEGLVRYGAIDKNQVTAFAPWRISRALLDSEAVQALVRALKKTGRLPAKGGCPEGQVALFADSIGTDEMEAL